MVQNSALIFALAIRGTEAIHVCSDYSIKSSLATFFSIPTWYSITTIKRLFTD